ncbi:thiol reductant ABC exporter subunit CydD [Acidisoma sp. L85]|uniref:thiol reductant ABC exporter subunit CydD n=1 Tax=Acidisoma sp. L85 TaxID=1641850 RepID=UPI0020B14816|nr:thiol reductant ABC exporter subunit CydD [Acidisoma sp. L85]
MLVLDNLAAIGFAAGLALGLTRLPAGITSALPWLVLGAASVAARGLCALASTRIGAAAARDAKRVLRDRIVRLTLALPSGTRPAAGALMTSAVDKVETLDGYVARFLPARTAVAGMFLILVAVGCASIVAAAILLCTIVPFVFLMVLAGGAAADEARAQFAALTRLGALFADRIRMLPLVLVFQAEEKETRRIGEAADELQRRTMSVLRIAFISSAGLEFFAALSVALVAVYAGFDLLGLLPAFVPEHLDLCRAFFVLALAPEFYAPMRRLAASYHDRQATESAVDGIIALESVAPIHEKVAQRLSRAPRIQFDHVTVRYPGEDRAALSSLQLDVAPGQIVALLGQSGTGKTTALTLLLGLTPPTSGEVRIDGAPLSELGSLTESIAWVGQVPVIIPGSIAANISLSRPWATRREVEAAAEKAGLGMMLSSRRDGLDTHLDERGGGLSGGERQRIALARALLKSAPILLLDEPTAHVDAASEASLIAAIARGARGSTTILATHSAQLAAIADRIVRLAVA